MSGRTTTAHDLAVALETPDRRAEVERHYHALVAAMNGSQVNGEQDAMCVLEAVALLCGQIIANFDDRGRRGALAYIRERAINHASDALIAQVAAPHLILRDDEG